MNKARVTDCFPFAVQHDSSPSPRTRRRGSADSIAHAISTCRLIFFVLSLSQRERMKVRDCSTRVVQGLTKWLQARCRVLPALDGSRSGRRQFPAQLEIYPVSDRVSRGGGNHDPNHPIRSQASRSDNRNPGCKDRWDAVAGICNLRSVDFGDGARECARNRSRSCGGNDDASLIDSLIRVVSCEKRNYRPLTSILSPIAGRGAIIRKDLS